MREQEAFESALSEDDPARLGGAGQLDRLTRSNPHILMAAALMVYMTQILLVAVVLLVFKDTELFNRQAFAFTLIGCVLVWTGFQVRGALKASQRRTLERFERELTAQRELTGS